MDPYPRQFGLVIAFLLPGFVALAGLTPIIPMVDAWLHGVSYGDAGLGPPLYALIAATTLGMVVSCFRWLLVDHLHVATGVTAPAWDFSQIKDRLSALDYLIEGHYRYYQFYGNLLVAILWAYPIHRILNTSPFLGIGTDLGALILCAVLFAGSRDALAKYYQRAGQLIGQVTEKELQRSVMTNGIGHQSEKNVPVGKRAAAKESIKPEAPKKPAESKEKLPRDEK